MLCSGGQQTVSKKGQIVNILGLQVTYSLSHIISLFLFLCSCGWCFSPLSRSSLSFFSSATSSTPSYFFFKFSLIKNFKNHSQLMAINNQTCRVCGTWPTCHSLLTPNLELFRSDCRPLTDLYTDFRNSWIPGMTHRICGRVWTISGPSTEKTPSAQSTSLLLDDADLRNRVTAGTFSHFFSTCWDSIVIA